MTTKLYTDDTISTDSDTRDLQNVSHSDISIRKDLAKQIRDACINVGFLYGEYRSTRCTTSLILTMLLLVRNHGIPETVIERAVSAAQSFFALPTEKKLELDIRKTPNFRGYYPLLHHTLDPDNAGDMHEGFEIGWEEIVPKLNDQKRANDGAMAGGNVWPDNLPGFREDVLSY